MAESESVFPDALLPAPLIYRELRISKATFYRLAAEKDFPAPVVLSERIRRWSRSSILAYVQSKTKAVAA